MAQGLGATDDAAFGVPVELGGELRVCQELDGLLAVRPKLLLIGGPGTGKTTALRRLARRAAAARTADPRRHPLPVYVPLARWPADRSFAELMTGHDDTDRMVLLDGIDELEPASPRIHEVVDWLAQAAAEQVIIAGRPGGFDAVQPTPFQPAQWGQVTLSDLRMAQVREIAQQRLGERAPRFLSQVAGSPFSRNPYLLNALLFAFGQDPRQPLPSDTGRLLARLAEAVWEQQRRRDPRLPPWAAALEGHVRLARMMDEPGGRRTPQEVVECFGDERLPAASLAAGLLVRDGRRIRFEHDWLRAYFLATAMAGIDMDHFIAWCQQHPTRWHPVAVAWSSVSPHADALVAALPFGEAAELIGAGYLAGTAVVRGQIEQALDDLEASRFRTMRTLSAAMVRIGERAVPTLAVRLATSTDDRVRAAIAHLLGRIGGPAAVAALRPMLPATGRSRLYAPVLDALTAAGADIEQATIQAALTDPDMRVRAAAVRAAGKLGTEAPAIVLPALTDRADAVRLAAVAALSRTADRQREPAVVAGLLSALIVGPERIRRAAAASLVRVGPVGHTALRSVLAGNDSALWPATAEELLRAGLVPAETTEQVRAAAAVGAWDRCRRFGAAAVPQLRRMLPHADGAMRHGIASALRLLGDKPAGTDPVLFSYYAGLTPWDRLHRAEPVDLVEFAAWTTAPPIDGHPLREVARQLCTEAAEGIDEDLLRRALRCADPDERMLATVVAGWSDGVRAELVDALANADSDLEILVAVQALGEQATNTDDLTELLGRVADAVDAVSSATFAEAVLVAGVQAVGRAARITDLLDEIPVDALGVPDGAELLADVWSAVWPDQVKRLERQSVGQLLPAFASLTRAGLPDTSRPGLPLAVWEIQRRVTALSTVLLLAGLDRQCVVRVLRAMRRRSPSSVQRVLDAVAVWASPEFAVDAKDAAGQAESD